MGLFNELSCEAQHPNNSLVRELPWQPPQVFTARGFEALVPCAGTLGCAVCLAPQLFLLVCLQKCRTAWSTSHHLACPVLPSYFLFLNLLSFLSLWKEEKRIYPPMLQSWPEVQTSLLSSRRFVSYFNPPHVGKGHPHPPLHRFGLNTTLGS